VASDSVSDYEGHMGHPNVQQLPYLSAVFQEVLRESSPTISPCSMLHWQRSSIFPPRQKKSSGSTSISNTWKSSVNGTANRLPGLELQSRADLLDCAIAAHSMDLVHGATHFRVCGSGAGDGENRDVAAELGRFSVVLQLPSAEGSPVTETPYESLRSLQPIMKLVSPELIAELAIRHDFKQLRTRVDTLPTGKEIPCRLFALAAEGRLSVRNSGFLPGPLNSILGFCAAVVLVRW